MKIREASVNDIPQMLALWRNFWPPQGYEHHLKRKIETDNELVLVAESDGMIVGTVIGGFDGWWGWIYRLAVSPTCQRQGIATDLLVAIHKRLADRDADAACLITDPTNAKMRGLLNKLGYQPRDDKRFSFIFQNKKE